MSIRLWIAVLALLIAFGGAGADDANKTDLAALQGEWQMVSGENGGVQFPAESAKTGKRVCKDDQVTVTFGGMMIMKAAKNPKTIDYKLTDGPNKGKTQLGIYELNDDTFRSCFAA